MNLRTQLTSPLVRRTWAACICAVLSTLWIQTLAAGSANGEFGVQESGYWTCETGPYPCIYWLDNDRVIFNGTRPDDVLLHSDGRRVWNHAIYIWDTSTSTVSKYANARRATLCYADGYIRYERQEGREVVTLAGPLGRESEILRRSAAEPKKQIKEDGWNTKLSCDKYRPQPPYPLPGYKIGLRNGHGFLYLGNLTRESESQLVGYFRHGTSQSVDLPVTRWQLSPVTVVPSEWDDSYLLYGPHRARQGAGWDLCPKVAVERNLYHLELDGRTSKIAIPAHENLRCYVNRFERVQSGILAFRGGGHARNLDLSRLYLVHNNKIREVIRGVATDHQVSPNGCRLAVAVSSNKDARRPSTAPIYRGHLKVVDLCREGEK